MPVTSTDPAIRLFASTMRHAWSKSNVDNAVRCLERTKAFLAARPDPVRLLDATRLDLQEYLNDRLEHGRWRDKPLSPNSVIKEHGLLRAFYRWAAEDPGDADPLIARNPMTGVRAPKGVDPEPESTPVLTEPQYRAMLAACTARRPARGRREGRSVTARRDVAILSLMWSTGGRRGEIAGLRYGDIDWDTQTVHFARTKGRGKTKSRDCYFDDEALDHLTRYVMERGDHDGPLFETTRRIPGTRQLAGVQPNTITLMVRRRAVEAGLVSDDYDWAGAGFGAHAFRRAYSEQWLENGGSVRDLETNNGWKHDGRMASHYTRKAEARQAVAEARRIAEARRTGRRLRAV